MLEVRIWGCGQGSIGRARGEGGRGVDGGGGAVAGVGSGPAILGLTGGSALPLSLPLALTLLCWEPPLPVQMRGGSDGETWVTTFNLPINPWLHEVQRGLLRRVRHQPVRQDARRPSPRPMTEGAHDTTATIGTVGAVMHWGAYVILVNKKNIKTKDK